MPSRRSVLKRLGVALGVGTVGANAGCIGGRTGGDGGGGGVPSFASHLYDPASVMDADNVAFLSYDLGALYDRRGSLPQGADARLEQYDQQYDAVDLTELGRLTGIGYWKGENPMTGTTPMGGSAVLDGSFDPDAIRQRLRENAGNAGSMTNVGTAAGHDVYEVSTPGERASLGLATSTDSVAMGGTINADATGTTAAETIVEASGGGSGYYDASDTGRRIVDAIGDATMATGVETTVGTFTEQQSFENEDIAAVTTGFRGGGHAATIGDEEVTAEVVAVYAEGETPTTNNLENVRGMATRAMTEDVAAEVESIELSVDGRTVTATYTTTTEKIFEIPSAGPGMGSGGASAVATLMAFPAAAVLGTFVLGIGASGVGGGGRSDPAPAARFDWSYDQGESPPLQAVHVGGETIQGSNLDVVEGEATITTTEKREYAAGDELIASIEGSIAGETVRVVWTGADGRRSQVLSSFDVPT